MSLKFSANLGFLWPDRPLIDRIDAAARAGFKAIELHWPYDVPAEAVRARCADHGIVLLGVNTVRGDAASGEFGLGALVGREREFQAAVDQSIAFCQATGASTIHCMAGITPQNGRAAAFDTFVANLRTASARTRDLGLTLLLEPINLRDAPGYFYATIAEGAEVIAAAGCDNTRLMFDCYHVGMAGGDVVATLEQYVPLIGHVQIASVPARAEPDRGTVDYRAVFAAIERLAYRGWVGCEYKPAGSTDDGLGWAAALDVTI